MRLLVLTPRPIDAEALREAAGDEAVDAEVLIVAPATNQSGLRFWMSDADEAIGEAQETAQTSVDDLVEDGVDAVGTTGESEPALALQDALATFEADRIVIFSGLDADYRGDEGLADVEKRFGVPVTFASL